MESQRRIIRMNFGGSKRKGIVSRRAPKASREKQWFKETSKARYTGHRVSSAWLFHSSFPSAVPVGSVRDTKVLSFFPDGVPQAGAPFDLSMNRIQEDRFDPPDF